MEGFIGEIRLFAGNFAPRAWMLCEGQLLSIAQNTALFSILGTTYGGDGRTTFALPDLRGRAPVQAGHGPGLSDYRLGQKSGAEQVTLTVSQMPSHNHSVTSSSEDANAKLPSSGYLTAGGAYTTTANQTALPSYIGNTGGNQPVSLVQPVLALNYIICIQGIFPSRG
ncbi:MAG: tail fiber protein [Nannocystaceae bacterium]